MEFSQKSEQTASLRMLTKWGVSTAEVRIQKLFLIYVILNT